MAYFFEAVKLRYPEYYHEIANNQTNSEAYSNRNFDNEDEYESEM